MQKQLLSYFRRFWVKEPHQFKKKTFHTKTATCTVARVPFSADSNRKIKAARKLFAANEQWGGGGGVPARVAPSRSKKRSQTSPPYTVTLATERVDNYHYDDRGRARFRFFVFRNCATLSSLSHYRHMVYGRDALADYCF